MAIDGITIKSITNELNKTILGGRIQKIYQLNDHIILMNIYNNRNTYQLLISTNPQNARIHFSDENYDKPSNPPGFCMILRKHIQNSTIKEIKQIGLDRSLEIIVDSKDELGFNEDKKLMIDIMGKHSNIVLTNNDYTVIEAIKRISHEMSSVRAVYPGTKFTKLEDNKIDILREDTDLSQIDIPENYRLRKIFYMSFTGFGPQIGDEIAYRSDLNLDMNYGQLTNQQKIKLNNSFIEIRDLIRNNDFNSYLYFNRDKVEDYYPLLLSYKGLDYQIQDSISKALDIYYKENVNDNSLNQAKDNLVKIVENIINKSMSKLDNLNLDLNDAKDYEKYRIEGDLLSAVAHSINKGQKEIEVNNYYNNEKQIFDLNPKKNAWENIESKYKKSKKLHRSLSLLEKSIPRLEENIKYLQSIILQIENLEDINEVDEIKEELSKEGFIKKPNKRSRKKDIKSKPHRFITDSNNLIYVGKNNKQNEQITLREANPNDLFFHIKDLPGSHVILKSTYEISDDDILAAAFLAAKYSKNSNDRYIDVDYTEKKNVNKAKGSKPGMVYYTDFQTIRVDLENELENYRIFEN